MYHKQPLKDVISNSTYSFIHQVYKAVPNMFHVTSVNCNRAVNGRPINSSKWGTSSKVYGLECVM